MKKILSLLILITFIGCKTVKEVYTERIDTIYTVSSDTNYIYYQIECDSLYQPTIVSLEEGKDSKIEFNTALTKDNKKLDIKTTAKIDTIRIPITKYKTKEVIIEKKIPKYYSTISWLFWILLGLNLLLIVFRIVIKFYKI